MSIIWIYVVSRVRLAGCLDMAKDLTLDISQKLFNQTFIPAMLVGTIDLYHFVLLSLSLTLSGGHKVSVKQNLLASFSHTFVTHSHKMVYKSIFGATELFYNLKEEKMLIIMVKKKDCGECKDREVTAS